MHRRSLLTSLRAPLAHPIALAAALATTGAALGGCGRGRSAGAGAAAPQLGPSEDTGPVRVTTAVAQARQLPQTLALTGTLVPDQQSEVTPLVAGRVTEVLVERGTQVRQGQPLLRLRDVDYRSSAAAATAALEQSRARLGLEGSGGTFNAEQTAEVRAARSARDLADDALRRAQQLAQTGAMSDQDLQRAQQQAASAREQYNSALNNSRAAYFAYQNARVMAAQNARNVADSVVRAPFDGEIAERRANVGEYVSPQRAVVTLVRTDPLRIELQIPQERIPFVQRGQSVDVRIDAFPDRTFRGTIRYISASVRADTRSLIAEAIVPNPPSGPSNQGVLRPGIFVTARLDLGRQQPAASVPSTAVLTEAGTSRVFVIDDTGRVQERVVTLAEGAPDANRPRNAEAGHNGTPQDVLIVRGVQPNERVATDNLERLTDGARVVTAQ